MRPADFGCTLGAGKPQHVARLNQFRVATHPERGIYGAVHLHVVGVLLLALTSACTDQATRDPPLGPAFDETGFHTVFGSVLGPAGNICNSLPESSLLLVRVLDPVERVLRRSQRSPLSREQL